ncbi:MAG: hypothetical protein EXX96DRAFT_474335 [Benjaminiella poitrasii]|nr:MAG: hypothetical protein EXX96DRAFT_474335 [Benjaminiella poitrasii]
MNKSNNKNKSINEGHGRTFLLPPELLLKVFNYLSDFQPALYASSLVCKQWLYCVAPILYCHPQIKDTYRWATFILTLTRERMSFFYGDLIRSIDLSSGKSIANEQHMYEQEQEYNMKGLPFIIVSTSSLIQLSRTCQNITSLNLSYTTLLYDSLIAETGEYLSTLQRYAIQPGLTHVQIPIEEAIQAIGKECRQLTEVKIQRCEWVTAHVIWMFAHYCPNLKRLDARRSTKCTVKRLIAHVLEEQQPMPARNNNSGNGLIHRDNAEEEVEDEIVVEEIIEDDEENNNFRFTSATAAAPVVDDETHPHSIGQRLSSPMSSTKSLKDVIYSIIMDAKELGALDLQWLQEYS